MKTKSDILEYIEKNRRTYIDAALDIWEYSEPIFEEFQSSRRLADLLEEEGFRISFGTAGLPTAFIAEWGSGDPVIGYLGEYDALPDLSQEADALERKPVPGRTYGHGCGHHLLGTACTAAAIACKNYLEANALPGRIRFYGCPAEEGGGGKVIMNEAGVFDDCLAAISWHPTDDNGIWSINFHAQQTVEYTFIGNTGKDSLGAGSLDALKLFLGGASMLRNHLPSFYVIRSSILSTGDGDMDRLPEKSVVRYAYRTHTNAQVREAMEALHRVAKGAAVMTGCTLKAEYKTGYSELLPNRSLERIMYDQYRMVGTVPMTEEDWKYAERMHTALPEGCEEPTFDLMRLLYEEQAEPVIEQVKGKPYNDILYPFREIHVHKPGSTDICDVSWTTPTVQCVTACYIKDTLGHSWQEVAQGRNAIPMKGMLVAAKVMALTGIELLANEKARDAVREEFKESRAGKTYIPLLKRTVMEEEALGSRMPDSSAPLKRIEIDFTGIDDNGLAARQTGKAQAIGGNAREALELFWTGMEYAGKTFPPSVTVRSRVLDTGDRDMIKVPRHTAMCVELCGDSEELLRKAAERLGRTAKGAALMTGCESHIAVS